MTSPKITTLCGAALVATVLACTASSASSASSTFSRASPDSPGAGARLQGFLALTVTGHPGGPRFATLTCTPDGGSHRDAVDACDQLRVVDGRLRDLNVSPGECTREWNPRGVFATGIWEGRPVLFRQTYPNPCVLVRTTGAVFAF